jgi:zinc D-Ala-D-Ala dipeptidase
VARAASLAALCAALSLAPARPGLASAAARQPDQPASNTADTHPAQASGLGPAGDHPPVEDADDPLVDAAALVPGLIVDLTYAKDRNLAGKALYPKGARCRLRRSAAEHLAAAARTLRAQGLRLVAWDCTRPAAAHEALFRAWPHPGSVADPKRGSLHQRGVAIDLGLADLEGKPVPLPTAHDAFGPGAAAGAPLPEGPALRNREALAAAMYRAGFRVNPREWWHFARVWGWRWPVVRAGEEL